jgi:hypothetical protein
MAVLDGSGDAIVYCRSSYSRISYFGGGGALQAGHLLIPSAGSWTSLVVLLQVCGSAGSGAAGGFGGKRFRDSR